MGGLSHAGASSAAQIVEAVKSYALKPQNCGAQVSGQVYYHLSRARQGRRIRDVVLVRLEQIAPFPHDLVGKVRNRAVALMSKSISRQCELGFQPLIPFQLDLQ